MTHRELLEIVGEAEALLAEEALGLPGDVSQAMLALRALTAAIAKRLDDERKPDVEGAPA